MTDRPRELVAKAKWLREFAGGELVWCGRHAADEREALMSIADFIEQSLTPPEGDTVSEGVVEQVARAIAATDNEDGFDAWEANAPASHAVYSEYARAAITALQSRVSPQAGMREALEEAQSALRGFLGIQRGNGWDDQIDDLEEALNSIDAALSTAPIPMSEDAK